MFYALSWLFAMALFALWSLAVWALHAVAIWTVSKAGALSGGISGDPTLALPKWLASWVPPELAQWVDQVMVGVAPAIEGILRAAPALEGGLAVASWVIWGIGSVLLALLGVGLHVFIALWRHRGGIGSDRREGAASVSKRAHYAKIKKAIFA